MFGFVWKRKRSGSLVQPPELIAVAVAKHASDEEQDPVAAYKRLSAEARRLFAKGMELAENQQLKDSHRIYANALATAREAQNLQISAAQLRLADPDNSVVRLIELLEKELQE